MFSNVIDFNHDLKIPVFAHPRTVKNFLSVGMNIEFVILETELGIFCFVSVDSKIPSI